MEKKIEDLILSWQKEYNGLNKSVAEALDIKPMDSGKVSELLGMRHKIGICMVELNALIGHKINLFN